jgi:hypothetical protein
MTPMSREAPCQEKYEFPSLCDWIQCYDVNWSGGYGVISPALIGRERMRSEHRGAEDGSCRSIESSSET